MGTDAIYILAVIGAAGFAIQFRVPKKFLPPTILLGFATCVIMTKLPEDIGLGIKSVVGSIFVGVSSQLLARATGRPAQTFMIPSVIFLVPGRYIYASFDNLLQRRFDLAFEETTVALMISMGITIGLMLSNWIVPSKKPL
jgi:uncharacterized membrane protein YjjB (DUF3815 family)